MLSPKINIIPFQFKHWDPVFAIYQAGIDTGVATFENQAPEWEEWDAKFLKECRIVASQDDVVMGWAALQPVSKREAYKGVAEVSVYVGLLYRGRGLGMELLFRLVDLSEKNGFWMLTASIFQQNTVSLELHRKAGFEIVGVRKRIAKKDGEWVDTVIMDRRSGIIGTE